MAAPARRGTHVINVATCYLGLGAASEYFVGRAIATPTQDALQACAVAGYRLSRPRNDVAVALDELESTLDLSILIWKS